LPLAALLPTVGSLTVITNFLPLLQRVRRRENLRVIGLGGDLLNRFDSFSGLICERAVASMRADLYITSSTAVLGNNVFHPDEQVVRVKRTMMASATKRYLLADHTKFGKTALHEFASLTDFNAVIVDDQLDNKTIQQMRDAGVRVLIARRQSRERS
jgi:DeoR/GlpR family transcriptional regulator of sugar metabolism